MEFKVNGYTLTDEFVLYDKEIEISPEIKDNLIKAFEIAISGNESHLQTLKFWTQRNPKIIEFKSCIAQLYNRIGKKDKAQQINKYLLNNFPDYLFGRLNMAQQYFSQEEFRKMKEMLGESMELKDLYPERKVFHILEFLNYTKMTVFYFTGLYNLDEAERRLQVLKDNKLDSSFAESIKAEIQSLDTFRRLIQSENERENAIKVEVTANPPEKIEKKYLFNHPELMDIAPYEVLDDMQIADIMKLPRTTLIQDLEAIIENIIQKYFYGESFLLEAQTAFHASLLLAELESLESLPKILELFRQDEYFVSEVFGDILTESMWIIFYKLGQNQTELLKQFMSEAGNHMFAKTEIAKAMEEIVRHQPERRSEIIDWFREVFEYFISCSPDDNIIDSITIGVIIGNTIDIHLKELLPQIKQLYELNYAFPDVCGDYETVEKSIKSSKEIESKEDTLRINQIYEELVNMDNEFFDVFEDDIDDEFDDDLDFMDGSIENSKSDFKQNDDKAIIEEKKIGRNEPCPCGSGKKYKKCCLNK